MEKLNAIQKPCAIMGKFNTKCIDISPGLDMILQIICIALLSAALAGLISISKIMKYEPIKVLTGKDGEKVFKQVF